MKERVFKRVTFDASRELVLVEFAPEPRRRAKYEEAILVAYNSKVPNPKFSNYFVRSSIGGLPAGNIEYGHHQALHGEECCGAALRSMNPEALTNPSEIVLGFAAEGEATITPCGNCRDFLRDVIGEDFSFAVGSPDGGTVVVATMRDLLFSDYQRLMSQRSMAPGKLLEDFLSAQKFSPSLPEIAQRGEYLECDPYATPNPFAPKAVHPERRYFACIVTKKNVYHGAHYVRCEYHPVYAGENAGIDVEHAIDYSEIRAVYFVRETDTDIPPDVMYRDRQHLMELAFERELVLGKELNPPVYLGTVWKGRITNLWRTSVKEWLPDRFSPHNFGEEFNEYLREYHKRRASL